MIIEIPNKASVMLRALRSRGSFSGGTVVDIRSSRKTPTKRSIAVKMVQPTHHPNEAHQLAERILRLRLPLHPADADVFEAERAQTCGIEQVLGVDDHRLSQQIFNAVEVESAELRPSRTDHQCVGAVSDRIG